MRTIKLRFSILFFMCCSVFGQRNDTIKINKDQKPLLFASSIDEAKNKFEQDLKAKKLNIYLLGGIVSVIKKEDLEFEKHYEINYHDFGCTAPMNFKVYEHYNQFVFNHLSKEYGKDWIASANTNAFGFKKWK